MLVDEMMQSAHLYVILHDLSSTKKTTIFSSFNLISNSWKIQDGSQGGDHC